MENLNASGLLVKYQVVKDEFPWLPEIWRHLKHILYQNPESQRVHVYDKFDPLALMRWSPVCIGKRAGACRLVEVPFGFRRGVLAVLDFNLYVDGQLMHNPGTLEEQLENMGIIWPQYIVVSSLSGAIGLRHDLSIFIL